MQNKGFAIPSALQEEHREIHTRLEAATHLQGKTGEAARALAEVLHPHFQREEQIALPPLGLLQQLVRGGYDPAMAAVLPMTDSLRAELPKMIDEHKTISAATRRLQEAARAEGQKEAASLAGALLLHAQNEEQVLYPAAVLVGDLVRQKGASAER